MERIKDALEKARATRKQTAAGSRLGKDRILARDPFRSFDEAEQNKLLESARVLSLPPGETLHFAGDNDQYIHYLLSGVVVVGNDGKARTVRAEDGDARVPLDHAGVKSNTITAASDIEILRVPASQDGAQTDIDSDAPLPPAAYTETYSGQQLASLVEQINEEQSAFEQTVSGISDTPAPPLVDPSERALPELSVSAKTLLEDLEVHHESPAVSDKPLRRAVDDELGQFVRELEMSFRQYVEQVKAEERARYETQLQTHAAQLQSLAEEKFEQQLNILKAEYENSYREKSRRLRDRYHNLKGFANKIARQKAAIYVARRQISEKLQMVERIQSELAQLGSQLNQKLDDLDEIDVNEPDSAAG